MLKYIVFICSIIPINLSVELCYILYICLFVKKCRYYMLVISFQNILGISAPLCTKYKSHNDVYAT